MAGRPVAEIFATDGEAAFRALERAALADVCASPQPLVIACGGGAMGDADNRRRGAGRRLRRVAAPPTRRRSRLGSGPEPAQAQRPLLAGGDPPVATLERLATLRAPPYEAAAARHGRDRRPVGRPQVADLVLEELDRCHG